MLKGKQKRHLRSLGHGLRPVVMIGKNELSPKLTEETEAALKSHELIKVKILESCDLDKNEIAESLAKATGSEVAQILGRTFLLYRQGEEPRIELPK